MNATTLGQRLEVLGIDVRQIALDGIVDSGDLWEFPDGWILLSELDVCPGALVAYNPTETVANQTSVTISLAWTLQNIDDPRKLLKDFIEPLPEGGQIICYNKGEAQSVWYGAGIDTSISYQYGELALRARTRFDVLVPLSVSKHRSGVLLQRTYHMPVTSKSPDCRPLSEYTVTKLCSLLGMSND